MIKKIYDLATGHDARTLCPTYVGNNKSGWQIRGKVHEDYFEWVNYFEAFHPDHGIVYGDFEDAVYASDQATLDQFLKDHPFEDWDYWEI